MPTPFYMAYPPLPNQATQDFITATGITATGNLFDDFRSALVSILGLTDSNALTLDDLWQLYVINLVSTDGNTEAGNPASAGRGKSGFVGGNPGHYYAESHRRNAAGGGFFTGGGGGFGQLGTVESEGTLVVSGARGVWIKADGTQMQWYDTTENAHLSGVMSTPYDITTLGSKATVAQLSTNNSGVWISADGLRYLQTRPSQLDYTTMGTAFDITSLVAPSAQVTISLASNQIQGVFVHPDEDRVFFGRTNAVVQMHDVSTPEDYSTMSTTLTNSYDWSASLPADQLFAVGHIAFSADGTLLYTTTGNHVIEHALGTAWDLTTAASTGKLESVGVSISGIFINDEGLYVMTSQNVYRLTAFDSPPEPTTNEGKEITQMWQVQEFSPPTGGTSQFGLAFKSDGTEMYTANTTDNLLYQYTLSTPWDISTATETGTIAENLVAPSAMFLTPDGTRLFQTDANEIIYWDLGTPWDITTAVFGATHALTSQTQYGVTFNPDGTKMFLCDTSEDLHEYALSTAWLPSSKTLTETVDIISFMNQYTVGPNPSYLDFDGTGNRLYITGAARQIFEFYLPTAYDITGIVYAGRMQYQTDTIGGIAVRKDTGNSVFTVHAPNLFKEFTKA